MERRTDSAQIETLLSWCSAHNLQIDQRLQVVPDNTGLAVYSGAAFVNPSQTLIKIPKSAVLSVKSCSASQFIETSPYGLDAQLALSLALLIELERGRTSIWYGYLQSLPDGTVDLPLFWGIENDSGTGSSNDSDSPEALKWLEGTEIERLLFDAEGIPISDRIRRYFAEVVVPTMARLPPEVVPESSQPTLQQFFRAYSLVSSRAFLVDAYHGLSMVAIADAFNHSYDNHVHLETEYEVCPDCGSLQQCPHDQDPTDFSSPSKAAETEDDYEMVSNANISPHSEVFNTYGETLTNAQLIAQYGFSLDVNENDRITWQFDDLVKFLDGLPIPRRSSGNPVVPAPNAPFGLPWKILADSFDQNVFIDLDLIDPLHNVDVFCVTCEGKVSWQLWLLISSYFSARLIPADEMLSFLARLGEYHTLWENGNEDTAADGDLDTMILVVKAIAFAVVSLCQERKTRVGRGTTRRQLGDLVDHSQPRAKLVLLQVITELSILESSEALWSETDF
ncbi:hypothetical protein BDP27DRAFT_480769 [Rhodocollybia butyracea]|uniref:SET domain-containing protein n=1 Tax=Rhodocollybia butyracea TaxID=206335 RepID=A0A9P5Q9N8_9AGAR|nr:hypothetical protein BDP27DRAFT_480769 [Rhodocollybia butyracea]